MPLTVRYWILTLLSAISSSLLRAESPLSTKTHQLFTFALQSTTERRTPRQARHLAFFSELTTDIHNIDSHANCVADALSRNMFVLEQSTYYEDLEALTSAQGQHVEQ